MRHSEFQQWLRNLPTISLAPERDALARSKRVETFEGDLDGHFATDRMAALLARLAYSREDERSGRKPRHSITFSDGANIREGTAALAGAVRLYLRFRDDVSGSTDPIPPRASAPISVVPGPIVIETPRLIPLSQVDQYLGLAGRIGNATGFDFFGRC
jgi:hypothetical protein